MRKIFFLFTFFLSIAYAAEGTVAFSEFTLGNGFHVVFHEDHSTPVVCINICYHVGSKNETPDHTGFAHLFEHLLFDGSKNVPRGMFDTYIYGAGGDDNAFTTEDKTNYYDLLPSNNLSLGLWLESDRMMQFAVGELSVQTQKEVVKEEKRQRVDNRPYGTLDTALASLFRGTSYGWPVIGSMEDLNRATLSDVRDFFEKYYTPNNAVLVISGDIDPASARREVEKYFGDIRRSSSIVRPTMTGLARQSAPVRIILTERVPLPAVYFAYRGPAEGTYDYYALDLAMSILGRGESSRLYSDLVYRDQIASEVTAALDAKELAGTIIVGATAVSPETTTERLERSLAHEIDSLIQFGPGERELEKAKNAIETAFVNSLSTILGKAERLAHYYTFYQDAGAVNKQIEQYRRVTPQDVRRALQQYLTSSQRTTIVFSNQGDK